jgi:hypothetical protein
MKYTCYTVSGGGTEHDAGIWERIETPKTITFKYTGNKIFEPNYTLIRINKFYRSTKEEARKDNNYNAWRDFGEYIGWMNNGHFLRDWKDGTYTAYPQQCGTPYVFTPLKSPAKD